VSKKQAKLMRAVAHNKEFADKVDIPQSVGRDFYEADKRKARRQSIGKAIRRVQSR
jgi:hypothetical protein